MKKGDDRRKAILETAEGLFYEKGYEGASIQDILDALNLSKGGFYHHFDSKMALLEAICDRRAEDMKLGMRQAIGAEGANAVDKLNALFKRGGLLHEGSVDFVGLMLRVAYRGDGVLLRERMKRATIEAALPMLNAVICDGIENNLFFTRYPDDIGELLLMLFANLTDEIAQTLAGRKEGDGSFSLILSKLEVYRNSVEQLLNAPYGSVVLFEMEQLDALLRAVESQDDRLAADA